VGIVAGDRFIVDGVPLIEVIDGKKYFFRFTRNQRVQHIILAVSVILLFLTGMPLKFHDRTWAPYLFSLLGGLEAARVVHRIAGAVLVTLFLYHLGYLAWVIYKKQLRPLINRGELTVGLFFKILITQPLVPNLKDVKDILQLMKYLFFLTRERPRGSRFRWIEKFDYLAPFWGVVIIGGSGLMMFDIELSSQLVPGIVINYALVAHSEEALLATLFLILWHWYNVHYSPAVFPMSSSYLTGYLPEHLMVEEYYEHYVEVMTKAGLDDEILPPQGVGPRQPPRLTLGSLVHTTVFGLIVAYMITVLWQETFGHIIESFHERREIAAYVAEIEARRAEEATGVAETPAPVGEPALDEILAEAKTLEHDLGYRVVEEKHIVGRFHHTDMPVERDTRSYCMTCHGDIPHKETVGKRAFWNMHSHFIGCETCHVRLEGDLRTGVFEWYDRKTGEIIDTPVVDAQLVESTAKIIPFEHTPGGLGRVDSVTRIEAAAAYLSREEGLTEEQKTLELDQLHEIVTDVPYQCDDCHQTDDPLLPYEALGYPQSRIDAIRSNEVVGVFDKYRRFYLPELLEPPEDPDPDEVGNP
jgi:cytochrome b subunit of formate dehydrogenase